MKNVTLTTRYRSPALDTLRAVPYVSGGGGSTGDLSGYYTKAQTDALLILKAGLADTQTFTGINTFYSGQKINNPDNTFAYTITAAAIADNRILNLPLLTGTDTLATLGLGQIFIGANTFSGVNTLYSGQRINNPANTFYYTLTSAAIDDNRVLNIPLITGTDTLAVLGLAQTFSGVLTASATPFTLSANSAVLSFSSATGDKTISTGGTTNLVLAPGGDAGIDKSLGSTVYSSGFTGAGWRYDVPTTRLTVDNLTVRKQLRVYELLIEQIRANRGALVVSPGDAKVDFVVVDKAYIDTGDDDRFPLSLSSESVGNDIIRCQRWSGSGVKYYMAEVIETGVDVGGDYDGRYWFKWTLLASSMDDVEAGDEVVVFGNTGDTDRQGLIYLTASDDNAPYMDILDGVVSDDLSDKTKVRLGKLDGIVDADFGGALSGYGLYSDNVYLKGKLIVEAGSDIDAVDAVWPQDTYLFGHWSFDELSGTKAYDASKGDNHGTLVGTITRVNGIAGNALSIEAAGRVDIPTGGASGWMTVSAWINPDSDGTRIIFAQEGGSKRLLYLTTTNQLVWMSRRSDGSTAASITVENTEWTPDQWNHICAVQAGVSLYLYINGELVKSEAFADIYNTFTDGIGIGSYYENTTSAFYGYIDEVRLYGTVLTAQEIRGLYKYKTQGTMMNANNATRTVIEGGLITTGTIQVIQGGLVAAGITGNTSGDTATRFWAGSSFANRATAPFNVTQAGELTASSGTVGGWTLDTDAIYTGTKKTSDGHSTSGITLASNGTIHTPYFRLDSDGSIGVLYKNGSFASGYADFDDDGVSLGYPAYAFPLLRLSPYSGLVVNDNSIFSAEDMLLKVGLHWNTGRPIINWYDDAVTDNWTILTDNFLGVSNIEEDYSGAGFTKIMSWTSGGLFSEHYFNTKSGRVKKIVRITATTTLTGAHHIVICNNTSNIDVDLPSGPVTGQEYIIKRINSGAVVIDAGAKDIIGPSSTGPTITIASTNSWWLVYDGTAWNVLANGN